MRKDMNKKYEKAQKSLHDILKTLRPYTPKTPQKKESPEPTWESMGNDMFPIPQHKINQKF